MTKIKNLSNELKIAVEEKKPFNVYLKSTRDADYWFYDKMHFNSRLKKYQGEFGSLELEDVVRVVNGEFDHIRLEVAE